MGYKYKNPAKEVVNGKWKNTKCYTTWKDMMKRCYNERYHEMHATYIDCTVCSDWHYFDNFYIWYQDNYKDGFVLDKDILCQGNKVYSPDTCVFVPQYINTLLIKRDASRGETPIGVSFYKRDSNYKSQLNINGKLKHIGYFTDPLSAHQAYCEAKYYEIERVASLALECGDINWDVYDALIAHKIEMY